MCEAICKVITHQTQDQIINGRFSTVQRLFKNGKKSDSFGAHFEQHFKYTMSCIDPRNRMKFKEVNQFNLIGAMKKFTEPNWNLCMEEHLTILKNLHYKTVTLKCD